MLTKCLAESSELGLPSVGEAELEGFECNLLLNWFEMSAQSQKGQAI